MCVDLSVIPTCQFLADLALLVSVSLSPSVRLPDACFSRITQCFSSTLRTSAKETQLSSTALGAIVSDVSARVWKSVFCHIGDAGSQHQRMLCELTSTVLPERHRAVLLRQIWWLERVLVFEAPVHLLVVCAGRTGNKQQDEKRGDRRRCGYSGHGVLPGDEVM